jgi:hypothetical protein
MSCSTSSPARRAATACVLLLATAFMGGCAVISVATTVGGLAVDAAVGTVKLTGRAIGAAADVVLPESNN